MASAGTLASLFSCLGLQLRVPSSQPHGRPIIARPQHGVDMSCCKRGGRRGQHSAPQLWDDTVTTKWRQRQSPFVDYHPSVLLAGALADGKLREERLERL